MTEMCFEGRSHEGRRVRLTRECGQYFGAAPYYAVVYYQRDEVTPQSSRYTPFREIAEHYVQKYLADVTKAAELHAGVPVVATQVGDGVIQTPVGRAETPGQGGDTGARDFASASPHLERESDTGRYDSATRRVGARRGGRPRVHRDRRAAVAAASRAYRERQRAAGVLTDPENREAPHENPPTEPCEA